MTRKTRKTRVRVSTGGAGCGIPRELMLRLVTKRDDEANAMTKRCLSEEIDGVARVNEIDDIVETNVDVELVKQLDTPPEVERVVS